jgi:hypothetical protein
MMQFLYNAAQGIVGDQMGFMNAIDDEGEILIVLHAIQNMQTLHVKVVSAFPLHRVRYQDLGPDPSNPCRWFLNDPLPKSLFDGTASQELKARYGVCAGPELEFPIPATH